MATQMENSGWKNNKFSMCLFPAGNFSWKVSIKGNMATLSCLMSEAIHSRYYWTGIL